MGRIDKPVLDETDSNTTQPTARAASRTCLMCGDKFPSSGTHNRICKRCKSTQAWREGRDAEA